MGRVSVFFNQFTKWYVSQKLPSNLKPNATDSPTCRQMQFYSRLTSVQQDDKQIPNSFQRTASMRVTRMAIQFSFYCFMKRHLCLLYLRIYSWTWGYQCQIHTYHGLTLKSRRGARIPWKIIPLINWLWLHHSILWWCVWNFPLLTGGKFLKGFAAGKE